MSSQGHCEHCNHCEHQERKHDQMNHSPTTQMEIASLHFAESVASWAGPTEESVVLDFGCGTGVVGQNFLQKAKKVVFLDPSPKSIAECHRQFDGNPKAEICEGDLLDYHGENVDLVVASLTLHHVDDINVAIEQIKAVLKPGGKVGIVELFPGNALFLKKRPDIKGFTPDELKQLFLDHGFVTGQQHPADPYTFMIDGTPEVVERYALFVQAP